MQKGGGLSDKVKVKAQTRILSNRMLFIYNQQLSQLATEENPHLHDLGYKTSLEDTDHREAAIQAKLNPL